MNDSSDSEYEDTEYLVYADFKNHIPPFQLKHENAAIKVIGIEGSSPMAEVNGNIYKGTYEQPVGTYVFFEKEKDPPASDPLFESVCRQRYKYVDKSTKVLSFVRTYIENVPVEAETEPETETEADLEELPKVEKSQSQSLKLNITYKEAINKFGEDN
ncbi:hypothetical protein KR018_012030 [Drosophila ironensis]|nr:hypothetical protein KR018_012030 [Drosophila ironensis]